MLKGDFICIKLKSKWTIDLNIKTETFNLLEDNMSKTFDSLEKAKTF